MRVRDFDEFENQHGGRNFNDAKWQTAGSIRLPAASDHMSMIHVIMSSRCHWKPRKNKFGSLEARDHSRNISDGIPQLQSGLNVGAKKLSIHAQPTQ